MAFTARDPLRHCQFRRPPAWRMLQSTTEERRGTRQVVGLETLGWRWPFFDVVDEEPMDGVSGEVRDRCHPRAAAALRILGLDPASVGLVNLGLPGQPLRAGIGRHRARPVPHRSSSLVRAAPERSRQARGERPFLCEAKIAHALDDTVGGERCRSKSVPRHRRHVPHRIHWQRPSVVYHPHLRTSERQSHPGIAATRDSPGSRHRCRTMSAAPRPTSGSRGGARIARRLPRVASQIDIPSTVGESLLISRVEDGFAELACVNGKAVSPFSTRWSRSSPPSGPGSHPESRWRRHGRPRSRRRPGNLHTRPRGAPTDDCAGDPSNR